MSENYEQHRDYNPYGKYNVVDYGHIPYDDDLEKTEARLRRSFQVRDRAKRLKEEVGDGPEPMLTITLEDERPVPHGILDDPPSVEVWVNDERDGKNTITRYRIRLEPV